MSVTYERWEEELVGRLETVPADLVLIREVRSTNDLARSFAREVLNDQDRVEPTLFLAFEQTRGRGRAMRSWTSPPGTGVYVSFLFTPGPGTELGLTPVATAVALVDRLRTWIPGCGLKWPNDLVADGGKLGGILVESVSRGGVPTAVVIGCGVNLEPPSIEAGLPTARGVAGLADEPPSLTTLTFELAEAIVSVPELIASTELVDRYRERSVHRPGDRISWRGREGRREGEFVGIDPDGALRLRNEAGVEWTERSGEIGGTA